MAQHEHGRQEQSLTSIKGLWYVCLLNQRNGQNSEQRIVTPQNRDDKSSGGEMRERRRIGIKMKRMRAMAVVLILCLMASQLEGIQCSAADCYDACSTACVQANTRLMQRCERKCQIRCDPASLVGNVQRPG